jgi:hypothetical protein
MSDPTRILIGLLKMMMTPQIKSSALIRYIETWHISIDTYLPSLRGETQMPLIYHCCSLPHLSDLFTYLIDNGVNLTNPMICPDPTQQIELLYYSQLIYIPTLIAKGCRLDPHQVPVMVEKLLVGGSIDKLMTLYKYSAITKEQLLMILHLEGLLFRVLNRLYEKVHELSQQVQERERFERLYNELMKSYLNIFKLFFKNGVTINQIDEGESFVQKTLNTYFIPLIQLVFTYQPELNSEELLHYSNFALTNRQVMCFIYTEDNYKTIKQMIKDKLVPKKINIKKNLVKKTISRT